MRYIDCVKTHLEVGIKNIGFTFKSVMLLSHLNTARRWHLWLHPVPNQIASLKHQGYLTKRDEEI